MSSPQTPEPARRAPGRARPLWILLGLLTAYYAFPVKWAGQSTAGTALSLAVTGAGLVLVAMVMVRELQSVRSGAGDRGARVLSMLLVLLVMASSLTFFLLNQARADELVGLETRTDALYFTVSTMTTVGYGDVHAQGQVARALVCVLIVFNVVVVASLVRAYTASPRDREDRRAAP